MYVNLSCSRWQNLLKVRSNVRSWAKRIYYDFVPIISQRSRIRPRTRARFIMQRKQWIRPMCSSLGASGGTKAVSSVVLIANASGLSFAVSFHFKFNSIFSDGLLLAFARSWLYYSPVGSAADYGLFGRWFLLVITCTSWAALTCLHA
jgi:hypothetical protein